MFTRRPDLRDARRRFIPNRKYELVMPQGVDVSVTLAPVRKLLPPLTLLLISVAAIRIFYMVSHDPMFGYGDQFDMGRTAACLDLWPELPGGPRDTGYFEAPVERHRIVKIESQECYPGMEAAFDKLDFNGHAIFWLLQIWAGLISMGLLIRNQRSKRDMRVDGGAALACTVLFCLAVVVMSVWVSALFGDGYSELARHLHLGIIASLASWLILIAVVLRYRPVVRAILVSLLALGSMTALRGLPLPMGGLSEPVEDRMIATASTFGG